jgi:hypothetical protein
MRIHAFTLLLVACGGAEVVPLDETKDELAYDDSSANLKARGNLLGEAIDILEVQRLTALEEYEAPALPGTDEEPDLSQKRLVSIEVKAIAVRDSLAWELQLDIEGELDGMSTGPLAPSEEIEISFQLENEEADIDLQDEAASGSIDIKRYDTHFGGTFDLTLTKGDQVTGSFFAPFAEPEVDVDD